MHVYSILSYYSPDHMLILTVADARRKGCVSLYHINKVWSVGMIRNVKAKMEEKHMESLYCVMNINTERNYVKIYKKNRVNFIPLPKAPKVVYDIAPPPRYRTLFVVSTSLMNIKSC